MISSGASLALASKLFVLRNPCFFFAVFLYLTVLVLFFFFSDDEGLSAKDAPDVGTANTGASKTLTASDAVKDSAPAIGTGKETTVPKKKAKKSNTDKGVVIISDNPSGPPFDDVSSLCVWFSMTAVTFLEYMEFMYFLVLQPLTQEYLDMASRAIGFRNEAETLRSNDLYFYEFLVFFPF